MPKKKADNSPHDKEPENTIENTENINTSQCDEVVQKTSENVSDVDEISLEQESTSNMSECSEVTQNTSENNNNDEVVLDTSQSVLNISEAEAIAKIEESYQLPNCALSISIQISAEVEEGRRVVMGLRSHQDPPLFTVAQIGEFSSLQSIFDELLEKFKSQLPERLAAAIDRHKNDIDESDDDADEEDSPSPKPKKESKSKKADKPKKSQLPSVQVEAEKPTEPSSEKVQLTLF